MMRLSLSTFLSFLALINCSSSTYIYARGAVNDRYCILASIKTGYLTFCEGEFPIQEIDITSGATDILIFSGFPSRDETSKFVKPKFGHTYQLREDYDFVWVAADGCLYHSVTPSDLGLFSTAFMRPCNPDPHNWGPVPNPYYWHGRSDWDPKPSQFQSGIGFEEPDQSALINNNEEFTPLSLSSPDNALNIENLQLATLPDNSELAFNPSSKPESKNIADIFSPSSSALDLTSETDPSLNPVPNAFYPNDGTASSGGQEEAGLLANAAEGGTWGTLPLDSFPVADAGVFSGAGDDSLLFSNVGGSDVFFKRRRRRG